MHTIIGQSAWAQGVRAAIGRVGPHISSVLIIGPSGTGKELIARAIHRQSGRRDEPFIPVDCATIPPNLAANQLFGHVKGSFTGAYYDSIGFFRAAQGGTIFLDEVGELELELQAKLLRVIQERQIVPVGASTGIDVDIRLIAATNRDLAAQVRSGQFREDLYYRLNVLPIATTALRARREDIQPLTVHVLAQLAIEAGVGFKQLSSSALDYLCRQAWPGNVRQLYNVLERAVVYAEGPLISQALISHCMEDAQLTMELPDPPPPRVHDVMPSRDPEGHWPSLEDVERDLIRRTLEHVHYNRKAASRLLKVEYRRLGRLIDKYGLYAPHEDVDHS